MCKIIEMKTRRVISDTPNAVPGMIDVYAAQRGKVGIDACVPVAVAIDMLGATYTTSYVGPNGMTGFDVALPPAVAERALNRARVSGISIRRADGDTA